MTEKNINEGIGLLIRQYKLIFRVPENLNHYSKEDYRRAEKKFLKYALIDGENLSILS